MLLLHQIILYVSEMIFYREYKKLIMTIDSKITAEKLQSDINREATKLSALSSGEISKYLNTNILEVKKYYLPIKHK